MNVTFTNDIAVTLTFYQGIQLKNEMLVIHAG